MVNLMKYKIVYQFFTDDEIVEYDVNISLNQAIKILILNGYPDVKSLEKKLKNGDRLNLTAMKYIIKKAPFGSGFPTVNENGKKGRKCKNR